MSHARIGLGLGLGFLFMLAACALPCGTFAQLSGSSLPYQDPTPQMLEQQAAEVAALEHRLAVCLWVAGGLAIVGLIALVYAGRHWRRPASAPSASPVPKG